MASEPAPETTPKRGLALYTKILIGLVLGVVLALITKAVIGGEGAGAESLDRFATRWIEPAGKLFLRGILLTVVPLVFSSIVTGIYQLGDVRKLGRMGGRTLFVYVLTSLAAASLATAFAYGFEPGGVIDASTRAELSTRFHAAAQDKAALAAGASQHFDGSLLQILVDLVPDNIAAAMSDNRSLLRVIIFSVLFGVGMTLVEREKAEPLAKVMEGINEVMIKLIELLMALAPYGVFALVFMVVERAGPDILIALAYYTLVVLLALLGHLVLVLLPLARVVGGWSPLAYLRAIKEVWLTAFSTSSSSATLPTTMRVAERELGIPREVSSFVLPLGSTVNMDGTTIYQIVAVHFVAQAWGIPIDLGTSMSLILVAMLMGIGAAGVPGGVIPLLYVVMATAHIPGPTAELGIALVLGMDRLLDMCRSSLNVVGDTVTATVVHKLEERRGHT